MPKSEGVPAVDSLRRAAPGFPDSAPAPLTSRPALHSKIPYRAGDPRRRGCRPPSGQPRGLVQGFPLVSRPCEKGAGVANEGSRLPAERGLVRAFPFKHVSTLKPFALSPAHALVTARLCEIAAIISNNGVRARRDYAQKGNANLHILLCPRAGLAIFMPKYQYAGDWRGRAAPLGIGTWGIKKRLLICV